MTARELLSVCSAGASMYMHNTNTGTNIEIPLYDYDPMLSRFKDYKIGGIPFMDALKVKDVYSDNGVVAEIKFNKEFWRMYQKLLKVEIKK